MSRMNLICRAGAIAALSASALLFAAATGANAAANDYRFELAGTPTSKMGVRTVLVRLIHVADRKPVSGAIIFQTRADMGPEQMAAMTAPVKAVPAAQPGVYGFEIRNGPVWSKPGKWALSLAAKVQGEADTVRGTVNLDLNP
ncbi:MAG: FixH family protein [Alphaproteobacteria bacterium]|nr:FixH family protein [Alphaproteobacteria bacterium]